METMKPFRTRGCLLLLGFLSFIFVSQYADAQPVDVDAAKKEGKVVVYGTVPPKSMSAINEGFEGKYGIKVEYWRASSTKVMDRALTEWRAGRPGFDVVGGKQRGPLLMKKERPFWKFIFVPPGK